MKRRVVNARMQRGYSYYRTEPIGRHFDPLFRPKLTPKEMLQLGVFGDKYMTDCQGDMECRRRQRQAALHWAYDSRKI